MAAGPTAGSVADATSSLRCWPGGAYRDPVSGHEEHAGPQGRVDDAGRGDRAGIALGVVLGAAVTWNLAANLSLPWALYVRGGLLLAAILVGVAGKIGGCRWSDLGLDATSFAGPGPRGPSWPFQ